MTADEIVTELTMSYSHAMHLVVEGAADLRFFSSALNSSSVVNIIAAHGSDMVLDVINKVDQERINGRTFLPTLGIVDRDYRFPLGQYPTSVNIATTDSRDLECMMINSPAFSAVLYELGSIEKIKKYGGDAAVLGSLIKACSPIACLRYFSQSGNLNISFRQIDMEKFVSKQTLAIDLGKFSNHLSGRQLPGVTKVTAATITNAEKASKAATYPLGVSYFSDVFLLLRGHDVMTALGLGLRSIWGSRKSADSSPDTIESYFRVAYRPHFSASYLFSSISNWLKTQNLDTLITVS